MTALNIVTVLWGVLTVAFIGLMIYRGNLANHETDQLFLNETTPSSMHAENDMVVRRLNQIGPICNGVGVVDVLLTLVVGAMWIAHTLPSSLF